MAAPIKKNKDLIDQPGVQFDLNDEIAENTPKKKKKKTMRLQSRSEMLVDNIIKTNAENNE